MRINFKLQVIITAMLVTAGFVSSLWFNSDVWYNLAWAFTGFIFFINPVYPKNIVYLELKRRGYKVYIGKSGEKEIDFVAENKEGLTYFQVALTVREESTLQRELSALQSIKDHYPKYILTLDLDPNSDYDGIKKINVLDWLLDKK